MEMEHHEIIRRAEVLFSCEGWAVLVKLLSDVDELAMSQIRATPDDSKGPAHVLASNASLRNSLRYISRLVAASNAGIDVSDPEQDQALPEIPDIFDD